ncbi:tyrosine-type recombinase/integrase [Paenibacillus xylanivorans]|uniref:phage integrase SAM-like domain-containing protein n=1 Tax=Paenibacillus xylanivorans TaxID=1705561 RepID=UPI0006B15FCD|nr:phage integrase SAM-like domain-containing protein [Paenibacillus xylanivorans]
MLQWLALMKHKVEFITYASYHNVITNHVVPYFEKEGLFLKELLPSHIQDYYQYELDENGVTTNAILQYPANIRKTLKHTLKNDLINTNPADKIERPKKNDFVGSFYNKQEINILFKKVKGEFVELAVILAAFYGLRRSEVIELKTNRVQPLRNYCCIFVSCMHLIRPYVVTFIALITRSISTWISWDNELNPAISHRTLLEILKKWPTSDPISRPAS